MFASPLVVGRLLCRCRLVSFRCRLVSFRFVSFCFVLLRFVSFSPLLLSPHPWWLGVSFVVIVLFCFVFYHCFVRLSFRFVSTAPYEGWVLSLFLPHPWRLGVVLVFCDHTLEGWALSFSLELVAPRFCVPRGFFSQGKLGRR